VRGLQRRGIVTGFTADVALARVGLPIQAMVALRLAGHDREAVDAFGEHVSGLPGVLAAHNVTGADDFLVHVAAASPQALREFVLDHLSGYPGVAHLTTSLIFRTHPGRAPLPMA
jgi:DNA-binding Lrp family transcriptional regulator